MKKCILYLAVISLLLSCGAVSAFALELPEAPWVAGTYAGESAEGFAPLGKIEIEWRPDFADQVNMTDGDLRDWVAAGVSAHSITADNVISWVGGRNGAPDPAMPESWGITGYYVADPTYLYMAFDVTDSNFVYGVDAATYNGDAIQLAIDFGELLGETLEKNPDVLANKHNIFYSFSCQADGSPLVISKQESDADCMLSEANGNEIKGAARKTDKGWSVELAISFQTLYDDYCWKAWAEDPKIYLGSDENLSLKIGMTLSYLNRETSEGEITWAAAAALGMIDGEGGPQVSWTAYDNGATLVLPYETGMYFDCDGLVVLCDLGTTAPPETEPPYDPDETVMNPETEPIYDATEPALEPDTEPPYENWVETETVPPDWFDTVESIAEEESLEDELNAILEKYGCSATFGMGGLTALLALTAAAYIVRKKK